MHLCRNFSRRKAGLYTSDEQITVADLTGVAVQDVQISEAVYEVFASKKPQIQ